MKGKERRKSSQNCEEHKEHEKYHNQWSDNLKSIVNADGPRVKILLTGIFDKVEV